MNRLMNDLLIERFKENISPAFWKKNFTLHDTLRDRPTDRWTRPLIEMRGRIRKHTFNHDV